MGINRERFCLNRIIYPSLDLEKAGIRGFVEPFVFKECSLRSKERAIQAIQESGSSVYGIVHDTLPMCRGAGSRS